MKNSQEPVILWFKTNLRLFDNLALHDAVKTKNPIIAVFINDLKYNQKAQHWLPSSLKNLSANISQKNGTLFYFEHNDAFEVLSQICDITGAKTIFSSENSSSNQSKIDCDLQKKLLGKNITLNFSEPDLLTKRNSIKNQTQKPYQKFAPFYNHLLKLEIPTPKAIPANINFYTPQDLKEHAFNSPSHDSCFSPIAGESNALQTLENFIDDKIINYQTNREIPSLNGTSLLSANLSFGEISPRTIWHFVKNSQKENGSNAFLRQLAWREFCHDLLFHYPEMSAQPIKKAFMSFPWIYDDNLFNKWKNGLTGYPLVDAGMRELNQTGYMHNRVRMITASFLTKHLLIPWQYGEKYFKETLLDYNEANNAGNWQWVAGCGMDSAPFFRIFNPSIQMQKFDNKLEYIKKYIPEINKNYPQPLVNHAKARDAALKAYRSMIRA